MQRLTRRKADGKIVYTGIVTGEGVNVIELLNEYAERLAAYEDTGLMPEEIIARSAAAAIADYAADEHPYDKDPEKPETFSEYNQGWNDACDHIRDKLKGAQADYTARDDSRRMPKSTILIDANKLIETLDEHGMLSLQSNILPGPERVYNVVRSAPAVDAVPRDYHERCLEIEFKKRIKAEKKQKLTEATNRQIIENYEPVVRCKDCKHFVDEDCEHYSFCMRPIPEEDYSETGYLYPLEIQVSMYDFCSYGERRAAQDEWMEGR